MWSVNLWALFGTATRSINTHTDTHTQHDQISYSVCVYACASRNEFMLACVQMCVLCQMRQSAGIVEAWRHHMVSVSLIDLSVLLSHLPSFILSSPHCLLSFTMSLRSCISLSSSSPLFFSLPLLHSFCHSHFISSTSSLHSFQTSVVFFSVTFKLL